MILELQHLHPIMGTFSTIVLETFFYQAKTHLIYKILEQIFLRTEILDWEARTYEIPQFFAVTFHDFLSKTVKDINFCNINHINIIYEVQVTQNIQTFSVNSIVWSLPDFIIIWIFEYALIKTARIKSCMNISPSSTSLTMIYETSVFCTEPDTPRKAYFDMKGTTK